MKIAIPTRNGQVDDHYGHCEYYTIFSISDGKITNEETFKAPEGCGCKSNIASIFSQMRVVTLLAGNMGMGALGILNYNGIQVVRGCSGNVKEVLDGYLKGMLTDSGQGCHNHGNCHNE